MATNVKLNLNLFNEMDILMWEPPAEITDVEDIRQLCSEFGSAIRQLDTKWSQELNNVVQVMKSTIDEVKIAVVMGDNEPSDKKFVIGLINKQLSSYDKLITKSKTDWVDLGYNPPRGVRRRGRRR